jgi:molybdopterin converting factor small subunit
MTINKNKKNLTFKKVKDSSALFDELCKIYKGLTKLNLRPLKNNLLQITVNDELQEDHVVLKEGEIKGGKNTIRYYIIKTNA